MITISGSQNIKVLVSGCNGVMGHHVVNVVTAHEDMEVVGGVDVNSNSEYKFPVYSSFEECKVEADVIIDFSHFSVIDCLLDYAEATQTPTVICTTGLDDSLIRRIDELSNKVALFRSGNMSLGINLLIDLVKKAVQVLGSNFDIEIVEKHHNRKVDSPSGTALMIADGINEELDHEMAYQHGRSGTESKRQAHEIGIHALRGGTIVGEHSVIFAGLDEIIEINHTALSRKVFANGAVQAAFFLADKKQGLYDMNAIL